MPWFALVLAFVALAGCSESDPNGQGPGVGYAAPIEDAFPEASCDDYAYWQDAQDALDYEPELERVLDDDYDGVACNELGQGEYESAWPEGFAEACEAVFFDSPDGVLYLDGTGYESFECEGTDPGPGDWEPVVPDPELDAKRDAWSSACEAFFNGYVGGDLFWGDELVVSIDDCEIANDYS